MTAAADGLLGVPAVLEALPSREATVGRMRVRRALPRRGMRTVGPWCFADQMGPELVTPTQGLDVGPHPHIGLHTATWLLEGAVLHKDSLGSEQLIRPGQLNLMTAGRGVVHAEEAVGTYRGTLHGVQLWLAQPDDARGGGPAFVHHAQLPRVELGASELTVLVGTVAGASSPARTDGTRALDATLGLDAVVRPGAAPGRCALTSSTACWG
jgi:quercetin 2,3-dioxygenase